MSDARRHTYLGPLTKTTNPRNIDRNMNLYVLRHKKLLKMQSLLFIVIYIYNLKIFIYNREMADFLF